MATGIEVAGAALGMVRLISNIFKAYSTLVSYTEGCDAPILLTRLRLERAKFETAVQLLSLSEAIDSNENRERQGAIARLLEEIRLAFDKAILIINRREKPSHPLTRALRWHLQDKDKLEELVTLLTEQNQMLNLFLLAHTAPPLHTARSPSIHDTEPTIPLPQAYVSSHIAASRGWSGKTLVAGDDDSLAVSYETIEDGIQFTRSPHQSFLTSVPAVEVSSPLGERRSPRGQLLEQLVNVCSELLTIVVYDEPKFAGMSDKFRLWQLAIESEGLYHAMNCMMRETTASSGLALENLILRCVIRLGSILQWYSDRIERLSPPSSQWEVASVDFSSAMSQLSKEEPGLTTTLMNDFTNKSINSEDSKLVALQAVQTCIDTLRSSLTTTVRLARHYPKQVESMSAPEVVTLLDAATELIEPASEALKEAMSPGAKETYSKDGFTVDLDSIQRTFNEQAALLQKWKKDHRRDVEVKLVQKNPSKLALVADAVENIGKILLELPETLADGTDRGSNRTGIQEGMKGFEVSVQSLVNLAEELDSMKAPPSYEMSSHDRVIIAVT